MNQNSVTIVMPNYNKAPYLRRSIDAALAQSVPARVLVIDDCSTDNSREILEEYKDRIDIILLDNNVGVVEARNIAIQNTDSTFIMNLDTDDYITSNAIACLLPKCDEGTGISYSNFTTTSGMKVAPYEWDPFRLLLHNYIPVCNLYRREAWEAVGGYDSGLANLGAEDWELWIAISLLGYSGKVTRQALYSHTDGVPGCRTELADNKMRDICEYIYNKYEGVYQMNDIPLHDVFSMNRLLSD